MKVSTGFIICGLALGALFGEYVLYSVPIFFQSISHATQEWPGLFYLFKAAMVLTGVTALVVPAAALAEQSTKQFNLAQRIIFPVIGLTVLVLLLRAPDPQPADALPAGAPPLPHYDVAKHCRDAVDDTRLAYDVCFDTEQTAYNALKQNWHAVTKKALDQCGDVAAADGEGSYAVLKSCLDHGGWANKGDARSHDDRKFTY